MKLIKIILVAALSAVCLLTNAYADDALKMQLSAYKVTTSSSGKVTYTPVNTASAGTVIQYKATYINTVDKDLEDLMVVLPVPANMTFNGEAIPISAQATVDGRNYADMPLMRRVDGKLVQIPLSEYRALRWNIRLLPAQKSATVAIHTIVN